MIRLAVRATWLAVCAAAFLWRWLGGPAGPPSGGRAARPHSSAGSARTPDATGVPEGDGRRASERARPERGNGTAPPRSSAGAVVNGAPGQMSAARSPYELQLPVGMLVPASLLLAVAAQFSGATAQALVLYGAAVAAFLAALYLAPRSRGLVLPIFPTRVSGAWLTLALVAAGGVLSLLQMLPSNVYAIVEALPEAPRGQGYWHVAALWVVSLVAYVTAFARDRPHLAWREVWQRGRPEVIAASLLIALGVAVRVFALDNFPHNFGGDEGSQALSAAAVLQGTLPNMFATGWYGTATLFYFLQAVPLALSPEPVVGARLASALFGSATLPLTYLLGRRLFGPAVALVALAFLATFDFHIFFSRLATYHVTDSFFVVAVLLFAYRALAYDHVGDYAACGLLLGLGFYAYFGVRVLPLVVLLMGVREAIARRGWLRDAWPRLLVLAGGMVIAAAPLLTYYVRHPEELTHRTSQVSVFSSGWLAQEAARTGQGALATLAGQLERTVLLFNYGPPIDMYYVTERALLTWPAGVAFVLGLAYVMFRARERAYFALAAAFWTPVLAATLTENMPQNQRLIITAPLVALCVGVGLMATARLLVRYSHIPRQVAAGGAALVVALAALMSLQFYFGQWAASARYGGLNTQASTDLGYYLRGLGPGTVAYFLGGRFWCHSHLTIAFIAPNARCVNVPVEQVASVTPVTMGGPVLLVALPEREPDLQTIGARVPGLQPVDIATTSPVRLLEVRAVPDSAAEGDTASLRAAVVRGMAAYFGAVGASVPLVELERGGWTPQGALTAASGDIARAQQEAVAQSGWPFAHLEEIDTEDIRLPDAQTARVRTTVVGRAGLTQPNGQVIARQRVSWVTECSLVREQGEWRMSAIRRLSQTELPDTGPG